jgi:dihydroorotate dehydrogenase (NAD+) catalytic subunit
MLGWPSVRPGRTGMSDISINIAGIELKNPVMVASGTFGSGQDYKELVDLNKLGALVAKSISLRSRKGNPPPRICETTSGMLNTIGLQNPGIDAFLADDMKFLSKLKIPVIINIAGESVWEYSELAKKLDGVKGVAGIEVNISCPNVAEGGMTIGISPRLTGEVISAVRKATKLPVIAKLTPNVTDITYIAKAAEEAGADAISAINTVLGMAIDINTRKTKLSMGVGGLSGPAIKPIAVRMVYQIAHTVKIPVIGIGGIMCSNDAIEFFLAGASAVQVGTANFIEPTTAINVANGIKQYLVANKFTSLKDIIGKVTI